MSMSIISVTTISSIGLMNYIYGELVDLHVKSRFHSSFISFALEDFYLPMIILLGAIFSSFITSILVKEKSYLRKNETT